MIAAVRLRESNRIVRMCVFLGEEPLPSRREMAAWHGFQIKFINTPSAYEPYGAHLPSQGSLRLARISAAARPLAEPILQWTPRLQLADVMQQKRGGRIEAKNI